MKKLFCILCLVPIFGCATVSVEKYETPDGAKKCAATYSSIFKDVGKMNLAACEANGSVNTSQADSALLESVINLLKKMP